MTDPRPLVSKPEWIAYIPDQSEWHEHIERDGYSGPRFVEVTRG